MSRSIYKKSWPRKNLGELVNFLEKMHPEGLALKALSDKIGITQQGLSSLFSRDDTKLSRAEKIAKCYGYTLKLYFPIRTFPIEGITVPPPKKIYRNAGNLSGLVRYINDSNYNIGYVANLIKAYPSLLNHAFESGDIQISKLYQILDALNICAIWKFEKDNESQPPTKEFVGLSQALVPDDKSPD